MSAAAPGAPECQKCHRPLRDAASIDRGYGPNCWASLRGRPRKPRGSRHAGVVDRHVEAAAALFDELEA